MGMKIGVLSDTHLYRVSEELKAIYKNYLSDMDFVLHAGDTCALEVVEYMKNQDFHGVSGNMDPPEVKAITTDNSIPVIMARAFAELI